MDRHEKYQDAIIKFLTEQGEFKIHNKPDVKSKVIIDKENRQYLLIWTGWDYPKYIHRIWYHFELVDDKIRVLANKTDVNLEKELAYFGINRKDLVAGWAWDYEKDAAA